MKRTILDQIEITSDNVVQIRLAKQVIDEGEVIASQWHRTAFMPHQDIDAQIAVVNQHLASMSPTYPALSESDVKRLKDVAAVAWAGVKPWVEPKPEDIGAKV